MIKKVYYATRKDGVRLYRTYSTTTPTLRQLPTNIIYDCWAYKDEENKEVDFDNSGVIDVEHCNYVYEEVYETSDI